MRDGGAALEPIINNNRQNDAMDDDDETDSIGMTMATNVGVTPIEEEEEYNAVLQRQEQQQQQQQQQQQPHLGDETAANAAAHVLATANFQNAADAAAAARAGVADTNRIAEQAVMGADVNDNVAALEVFDESGLLVQQRFVEFLGTL